MTKNKDNVKIKETLIIRKLKPTLTDTQLVEKSFIFISLHLLYANFSQILSLFLLLETGHLEEKKPI